MIAGVFLKNFKIYKQNRFVPISTGHRFSAFVGPNGAGKSSVLEGLNSYFNEAAWIVNKVAIKRGERTNFINLPFVCPIFVLSKVAFSKANKEVREPVDLDQIELISKYLWTVDSSSLRVFPESKEFLKHRDELASRFDSTTHYLLAAGIRYSQNSEMSAVHFGPFHQQSSFLNALGVSPSKESDQLAKSKANDELLRDSSGIQSLNKVILDMFNYVYIPSDVSIADYTKLETGTMQLLMGRDLLKEIKKAIPSKTLDGMNRSLEKTVEGAVKDLDSYTYAKPSSGKKKITLPSLARLITREFFSIRELSLVDDDGTPTPVSHLSSGEQRRALIDVTSNYLVSGSKIHQTTILAIDEPEISLHSSRCFDQFESLFRVARNGVQTLVTTHWYGFLPIAQEGNAHFLENSSPGTVDIDSYDLCNYKEMVKGKKRESRGRIPFDVSLKSTNDLVQSIASSVGLPERAYSWILCEGSSEKIYLAHMLKSEIDLGFVRVLPLGGAGEVLKLYRHLEVALSDRDLKPEGRVIALVDTDKERIEFGKRTASSFLNFKRLLLEEDSALQLVDVQSPTVSPVTAIEDALNPRLFLETLRQFSGDCDIDFDSAFQENALASGNAFDLKGSEQIALREFFGAPGRKVDFARKYTQLELRDSEAEPLAELIRALLPVKE